MIEANAIVRPELDLVTEVGAEILTRYGSRAVGAQFRADPARETLRLIDLVRIAPDHTEPAARVTS